VKKTDLAYMAGIIDGEGCICIHRSRTKRAGDSLIANVTVRMTVEHIPQWLHFSFGGSFGTQKPKKVGWQPVYQWKVYGKNAVTFLQAILPYLIVKRPQAEIALRVEALKPGFRQRSTPMDKFLQEIEAKKLINRPAEELPKAAAT
jgi:hypothetical protein